MAVNKENIKALFTNTRSRVIIIFTIILVISMIVIGVTKLHSSNPLNADSGVSRGPGGIRSIPGALNQTAQYAALQEKQNVEQAKEAETKGKSSIPTIIRSQAFGEGVESVGAQGGEGSVGFTTLARQAIEGPQSTLWFQNLKDQQCNQESLKKAMDAGANLKDLKQACTCAQLKLKGFTLSELKQVCTCPELKSLGFSAKQFKDLGYCAADLKACGFTACEERGAGFLADEMKTAGFSDGELSGSGFTPAEIARAGGLPDGVSLADVQKSGCSLENLRRLRSSGVSAAAVRRISGCSTADLQAAGFSALDLKNAGFTAAELKAVGFSPDQLRQANFSAKDLLKAKFTPDQLAAAGLPPADISAAQLALANLNTNQVKDCSAEALKAAHANGTSAVEIRQTLGCGASALKSSGYSARELKDAGLAAAELKAAGFIGSELKNAGFSAKDLRAAGLSAAELKATGFDASALKDAGFSAKELKSAGFSASDMKTAGATASELKAAGFSAVELKNAGFSATDLKATNASAAELKAAGYSSDDLQAAGFSEHDSALAGLENLVQQTPALPSINKAAGATSKAAQVQADNTKKLEKILAQQKVQMADQKFQQKVQQRSAVMMTAANQALQGWKVPPQQAYMAAQTTQSGQAAGGASGAINGSASSIPITNPENALPARVTINMGDVMFAVIDTSVNSDEPGPILATVVSGSLKGSKLIGTFNLPANAEKMVISFNSLSIPGAPKTISISAFAIDPNTARTALSSETDHHYLSRYGALFASTFLEGFGNAFQSADTTITIGGTGGTQDTTVQNGIGRSALENAVIGLAAVGKAWGQVAQQNMSRPTTVQVYSGTGIGVLFTQDVKIM